MAAEVNTTQTGKSGKKKKQQGTKMHLSEFIGESSVTGKLEQPVTDWGEAMEEEDPGGVGLSDLVNMRKQLPAAPKAASKPALDLSRIPKSGPYSVHIGNLPFESDDDQVKNFFRDLEVVDIDLVRNDRGNLRGYGFVTFRSSDDMIKALEMSDSMMGNRKIRIGFVENERSSVTSGMRREGSGPTTDFASEDSDWRRSARPPPPPPANGFSRGAGAGAGVRERRSGFGAGGAPRSPSPQGQWRSGQKPQPIRAGQQPQRGGGRSGWGRPSSPSRVDSDSNWRSGGGRRQSPSPHRSPRRRSPPNSWRRRSPSPDRRPTRHRSPSPRGRSPSPRRDNHSPRRNRSPSPRGRSPSPYGRSPSPRRHSRSPRNRSPSPRRHSPSPHRRSPSPRRRSPSPRRRSPSPRRRSPSPRRRSPSPRRRSPSPRPRSPAWRRGQAADARSGNSRSPSPRYRRRSPSGGSGGGRRDSRSPPRERKRLQLKPRTRPVETEEKAAANAAIFGSAKPVDTAAAERRIIEKLERQRIQPSAAGEASSRSADEASPGKPSARRQHSGASHSGSAKDENENVAGESSPDKKPAGPVLVDAKPPPVNVWEQRKKQQQQQQPQQPQPQQQQQQQQRSSTERGS